MSSGRSRGRARTSSIPQPIQITPGAAGTHPPPQTPTTPTPTPAPVPTPVPQRGPAVPVEQTGRGRGMTPQEPLATGQVSPTSRSSGESPPQQPSPPHPVPSGRSALRGAINQPGTSQLIGAMERASLHEAVGEPERRREFRLEQVPHTRPASCQIKTGTVGQQIKLLCNYFEVLNSPNWVLYQYHVDFSPVIDSRRMRIGLLKLHDHLFPRNKAFDGMTLYSLDKLHDEVTELASRRETDNQIITIKIKRIAEIVPTSPNFVHLFNLVFRRCLKLYGMKQIDRNYYDLKKKIDIQEYKLEFINGFSTSIAVYENQLLLCAELTHKLLHKTTVFDVMSKIYSDSRSDNEFKDKCCKELIGRVIMTIYNDKTYRINDIDWQSSPQNVFETSQGQISFIDYYKQHYQLDIRDRSQPLLNILPSAKDKRRGQTKPIMLVPELCILTGVDERMREDFRFKKAVEAYSKVGPSDRCKRLSDFINRFNSEQKVRDELAKWQMNFSSRPAEILGRVLPYEVLAFGGNVMKQLNEKADWGNDMKGQKLFSTVPLNNWIFIYPQNKRNAANMFLSTYCEVIRSMGINATPPKEFTISQDSTDNYINALKTNITDKVQMAVVIVGTKRKDRYDAIKRICCIEKPVPSQVLTTNIVENDAKRKSVVTKIAIQMNAKLGGEIWQTNIPITNVMICGIDTYHDSLQKKSSVCAFIATVNDTKTKFFSRATIQETHQELSNNLTITVKSACDHYYRVNGKYPEKIIIYRDGVSDGQLQIVLDYEIPQIKKAFNLIDPNYMPLMAFIVVKKRGNSRFFADTRNGIVNPPCGTIIDTVVTRKEWFDFYLISQYVTQGTVNPTHYNVIYDTIGLKPDHYQRLSYKLTHMYYNWPGTIRVPATCQYAHKLAFLVGQSLHKEHDTSLCDKLFYL